MSWTNKEFRRVLTSRSARNIWRAALESVDGLPPCPSHMNEIEYSTVLFHIACHVSPLAFGGDSSRINGGIWVWKGASSSELVLPEKDLQKMFTGPVSLLEFPQLFACRPPMTCSLYTECTLQNRCGLRW